MRGKFLFGAASAALLAACFTGAASAQTADPAADASTDARIAPGDSVSGELAPAGDRDWYRLNVASGMSYRITLDSVAAEGEEQGFDPVVVVYDASGSEVARNDDSDESLNSDLRYRPAEAGEVFVEARGFLDEAAGNYALRVEASEVPPDDVGNDAGSASQLVPGQSVNGVIGEEGDEDWYRLNARGNQIYRISLNGAADSASALSDPLLRIVDADGAELASNDDSNESLNSFLEFVPPGNGEVYLVAGSFGGATGAYSLNAEASRLPADDAGNGQDSRTRLTVGQSRDGTLDYASDRDWYRVRLEGGQSYRFTLASAAGEGQFDPLIRVHDNAGAELAVDDDGGAGLDSYLEFTAPADGEYFLEAQSYAGNVTGRYTIAARAGDIPADATTDASLSAEGDYRDGVLSPIGDKDWYNLELAAGQSLRIGLTSVEGDSGALADPYLVLYGPDGAEAAQDDDGGDGLNSWLEYTAATAGTYHVEVRGFVEESAEGRYSLSITPGEIGADAESGEYLAVNGEDRSSSINTSDDSDWFAVDLVEGRPYRFNLESEEFDPALTLMDGEGNQVASDDDGGTGTNAYLTFVSPTGGTYFAAVAAYNASSQGHYSLRAVDTDIPGNVGTDENLSPAGDDRGSAIEFTGDLDVFRVELTAGVHYTVELGGEGDAPLADPFLTVLNAAGETIATDDDSGAGPDARLRLSPETSDVYYLQASGLGGSLGAYRVSIIPEE